MARDCPTLGQEGDASCLTHPVVSLWYHSPELLLQASKYSYPIDLWAAGCVMAQMWTKKPLEPANILITSDGVIKIADFGMAWDCPTLGQEGDASTLTHPVVSLWYRAPELLLRASKYSYPIDLWAAGCVMAEMWTQKPLMKGDDDRDQLELITKLCGSIKPEVWPGVEQYLLYGKFKLPKDKERKLKKKLQGRINDPLALVLLDKLLVLNPIDRSTCEVALQHQYFHSEPAAADLKLLLSKAATSKMESLTLKD